jgi:hypothetical protein
MGLSAPGWLYRVSPEHAPLVVDMKQGAHRQGVPVESIDEQLEAFCLAP